LLVCVSVGAAENLGRGVVAIQVPGQGVYVGWRLLDTDTPETQFDVYRSSRPGTPGQIISREPIASSCNFIDLKDGIEGQYYGVVPVGSKVAETDWVQAVPGQEGASYLSLKLQGDYRAQKVGLGDFDGDGRLDFLVKQPNFNTDPYQQPGYWKKSTDTYKLEAYRHDGEFLWRYDMGWAIEEGIWYSPIVVFDLDGDGRAEVFVKAGQGDPRDADGRVTTGPEFLTMIDGTTGEVRRRIPWPRRERIDDYNYYSRNLMGIAYLDGKQPHLIVERGTYTKIIVQAYDPDLNKIWEWEAAGKDEHYRGQGMHGMHAADVDGDGRDELVIGSAVIDDDGTALWTTRLRHPDVCYVADIDPKRPGLEIFYGIEPRRASQGVALVSAADGEILWAYEGPTKHVHGQGMIGDIVPEIPGIECYAGEKDGSNYWLYTAKGERISDQALGGLSPRSVYWTAGPGKAYISKGKIREYPDTVIGDISGNIVAITDCLSDWREEVITSVDGEIRIYTTTLPARSRRTCLMQNRLYRNDVAVQTMGYFYPPQLGLE